MPREGHEEGKTAFLRGLRALRGAAAIETLAVEESRERKRRDLIKCRESNGFQILREGAHRSICTNGATARVTG